MCDLGQLLNLCVSASSWKNKVKYLAHGDGVRTELVCKALKRGWALNVLTVIKQLLYLALGSQKQTGWCVYESVHSFLDRMIFKNGSNDIETWKKGKYQSETCRKAFHAEQQGKDVRKG